MAALTAADRCDRCNAQARVRTHHHAGDLLWCAHHWRKYHEALNVRALSVDDQRLPA